MVEVESLQAREPAQRADVADRVVGESEAGQASEILNPHQELGRSSDVRCIERSPERRVTLGAQPQSTRKQKNPHQYGTANPSTYNGLCFPVPVEARGIEPRSEPRSEIAATCVGYARCLQRLARSHPTTGLAPKRSHTGHGSATECQPDFAIPARRFRRAANAGRSASSCLRCHGQVSIGSCYGFPVVLPGD